MPELVIDELDYGRMQLLRLRIVLVAFLKRWSAGLATLLVLFGAGSDAPLTMAAALAAMPLLPLVDAARHGWWIVPASVGYALAGIVPVVVSRALWWPRSWALAERALPLAPTVLRRSDRRIAAVILAPLQGLLLVGLVGMASAEHATDDFLRVAGGWSLSAWASLFLSVTWMTRVRRGRAGRVAVGVPTRSRAVVRPARITSLDVRLAAVVLPLSRGVARRSALVLVGGLVVTSATATASAWSDLPIGWTLALHAFCALAITSIASDATRHELQPLWRTNRALPIAQATCERWRHGVVLLPTLVGVAAGDVTALAAATIRVVPLMAYLCSVTGGCVIEAVLPRTAAAHDRAARWVLTLAVCVACASEVT